LIELLSEAQWYCSECGEAIMPKEMTESGNDLRAIAHEAQKLSGKSQKLFCTLQKLSGKLQKLFFTFTELHNTIDPSCQENSAAC
jgi:hypothetical protein